jgi:hypothetical protein
MLTSRYRLNAINLFFKLRILLAVSLCVTCEAESSVGDRVSGISAIFLKRYELTEKTSSGRVIPLPDEQILRNLKRYDAIWSAQEIPKISVSAWTHLRQQYPEQKVYYYVSGCTAHAGTQYDKLSYLDYDYINTYHPEWFLLADTKNPAKADPRVEDNRVRWLFAKPHQAFYRRFFLDVGNRQFQQWAAEQFLKCVSGQRQQLRYAFTGLAMDNLEIGLKHHRMIGHGYANWKYANNPEGWNMAFCDYLKVVKKLLNKHGFALLANQTLDGDPDLGLEHIWQMLYESVDGLMTEQAIRHGWGESPYFGGDGWLAAIERYEDILDRGLISWWFCRPLEEGQRAYGRFLYTYCSWLLIARQGQSFYYASHKNWQNQLPWYDVYDLPVGKPKGRRYKKNNCWLRDYDNVKIVVNPTENSQWLKIDDDKYWLDWFSQTPARELVIPPKSAKVLLPTPYNDLPATGG